MSLRGSAVIAIWQDLVPGSAAGFQEWHNRQHVPERLSIPGFLRARRFIAVEGGPEFYTLYELDRIETAAGKAYLDRLNAPTEWTRQIMPTFRNMARSACRTVLSEGLGDGGFLMTLRCNDATAAAKSLAELLDKPGIVGVHLCVADGGASNIATHEKTFRATPDLMPECVVMVEGTSVEAISRAPLPIPGERAIYRVEHSATAEDAKAAHQRQSRELLHAPA